MKKIMSICILIILSFCMITTVSYGDGNTYKIEIEIINNSQDESIDVYILLPKSYIEFAIKQSNLDIQYDGANTLRNNSIPGININQNIILDKLYYDQESQTEYVQIVLEKNTDGKYEFDILNSYNAMDIKLRFKNSYRDDIAHIDNFEKADEMCQIQYDYDNENIKQPNKIVIPFITKVLVIVAAVILVVGLIRHFRY